MSTEKQLSVKSAGLLLCLDCHKLLRDPEVGPRGESICPRCGAAVHQRRPDSLAKTWALAITALICLDNMSGNSLRSHPDLHNDENLGYNR